MKPTITSFGGHNINDGTNYAAAFPDQNFFPQASSQAVEQQRSDNYPNVSAIKRQSKTVKINIYPLGTFTTQINTLNGWFDTFFTSSHPLKVTDENSVVWYVDAWVIGQPHAYADYVQYTLLVPKPVWQRVTPATDSWSITASGQTHQIVTLGNRSVPPIWSFTPATKTNGYKFHEFRAWYNPQTTEILREEAIDVANAAWNTATLITDTTVSNQINIVGGINASVLTIPINTPVGGGLSTGGGLCMCGTEQILYTSISGGNMTVATGGRGVGGTVAASHANGSVISQSRMYADMRDFRIKALGTGGATNLSYWLSGVNTSATKVWIVSDFSPGISLTLSGALNNSQAVTTMTFKQTAANLAALKQLAKKDNFMFMIGSEVFSFNGLTANSAVINLSNYTITTTAADSRGMYSSTKASHADGDPVYWVEYVFGFIYGNSAVSAPVQDETIKPLLNLSSSTNTSWVWDTTNGFKDISGARSTRWKPAQVTSPGAASKPYTAAHALGADTSPSFLYDDPATAIGLNVAAFQQSSTWRGATALGYWLQHNGAGFTTFTLTLALYRYSSDWPANFSLEKSIDGVNWQKCTGFPEATPAGSKSWTAGAAHSSVSLGGTYKWLRLVASGSVTGVTANNVAAIEATACTLVRSSSNVMQLAYSSASITTIYHLQCTVANNGTNDSISIDHVCVIGDVLLLDCLNKNFTNKTTGENIINSLTYNGKRNYWITIEPPTANGGIANGDTFTFTDVGTTGLTLATSHYDGLA